MQVIKDQSISKLCHYCFNEAIFKITIHTNEIFLCERCKQQLTYELISN